MNPISPTQEDRFNEARSHMCTLVERDDALTLLTEGSFESAEDPSRALGEPVAHARAP